MARDRLRQGSEPLAGHVTRDGICALHGDYARQQRGGIIDLAEDFEREAGQLADRINDHNVRSDLVRNASRAAGESWQRLERALQRTNGITQYTIAEFQQLKSNFELLQRSLNQQR